jgi:hypothetical protein
MVKPFSANGPNSLSTSANSLKILSTQDFIISYLNKFISKVVVPSSFLTSLPV